MDETCKTIFARKNVPAIHCTHRLLTVCSGQYKRLEGASRMHNLSRTFMSCTRITFITAVCFLLPLSASAKAHFLSDGGSFLTLQRDNITTRFQMSPSSGGEPVFDSADLGFFSIQDDTALKLQGVENITQENSSTTIGLGRFCYRVYTLGDPSGSFVTNVTTHFLDM